MTPSGIEVGRNVAGERGRPPFPTEGSDQRRPPAARECNECNEAFEAARQAALAARRLALVADNAIANGDLPRARAVLRELQDALAPDSDWQVHLPGPG